MRWGAVLLPSAPELPASAAPPSSPGPTSSLGSSGGGGESTSPSHNSDGGGFNGVEGSSSNVGSGRDSSHRTNSSTNNQMVEEGAEAPASAPAGRRSSSSRLLAATVAATGRAPSHNELSVRIVQEMSLVLDADEDWDRHQKIQRALQRHNFTLHRLRLSDLELFGRERELNELLEVFHGVTSAVDPSATTKPDQPKVAVINVVGRAGTGKTRLCDELRGAVANRDGIFFLRGKFDPQSRREPLTGLVDALSGLKDQVVARGEDFAGAMRANLTEAIGNDAQALASIVPGIEQLVTDVDLASTTSRDIECAQEPHSLDAGSDPPAIDAVTKKTATAPKVELVEAGGIDDEVTTRSSRLQYLFRQLFRCVCHPSHPVVLMLDDVQWCDEATLSLLLSVVSDPSLSSMVVLATCREEEADAQHPWTVFLDNLIACHASKVAVRHVPLDNLCQPAVLSIVQAALRCSEERTVGLAEIVHHKSSGNVLYAIQFLSSLYDDGLLRFNVGSMSWAWDERAVQARFVTANVVDLTTAKLQKLPPLLQALLMMAACLGRTFDRTLLELVMNQERVVALVGSCLTPPASSSSPSALDDEGTRSVATSEVSKARSRRETIETFRALLHSPPALTIPESPSLPPDLKLATSLPGIVLTLPSTEKKGGNDDKVYWLTDSLRQLEADTVLEIIPEFHTYCFAHDKIQEAAFCLIPIDIRGTVQREVGMALLRSHTTKELDENVYFRAIELSNVAIGEDVISDTEKTQLVHHNLDAGKRAMKKGASGSALKYLEAGLHLIGDGSSDTTLYMDLLSGAVESAFCSGDVVALERHIATVLKVDTPIENKVRALLVGVSMRVR
jgi:AAA ATPase domain